MSAKRDALLRKIEQGERIKEIREAREWTGDQMAAELEQRLGRFGVTTKYDRHKVSRLEGGGRKVTVEEAVIIAEMDRKSRGGVWLVFGPPKAVAVGELAPRSAKKVGKVTARVSRASGDR